MNNETVQVGTGLNKFYSKIYAFMAMGIGLSAIVAYLILNVYFVEVFTFFARNRFAFTGIWLVEIVLVIFLGVKSRSNPSLALAGFIAYSMLNGVTLSITIAMYTEATVVGAFISASATFVSMALVGMFTKKDLSAIGHAAYSALFGIIIAMLLNAFILKSSPVDYLISLLMVVIFAGITAYDNQNIKNIYNQSGGQPGTGVAIFMALKLYLNFINLFIAFLRIFGKK